MRGNHTQRDQHVLFLDHAKQTQTRLLMRRVTLGPASSYAGRAMRRGGSSLGLLGFVISRVSHTQARDPRRRPSYAESEPIVTRRLKDRACHTQGFQLDPGSTVIRSLATVSWRPSVMHTQGRHRHTQGRFKGWLGRRTQDRSRLWWLEREEEAAVNTYVGQSSHHNLVDLGLDSR